MRLEIADVTKVYRGGKKHALQEDEPAAVAAPIDQFVGPT